MAASVTATSAPVLIGGIVAWEGIFSAAELDAIEQYGDGLAHENAGLVADIASHDRLRKTKVAWVERDSRTEAWYLRLEEIVLHLNNQYFRFDLSGLAQFQHAVYDVSDGGYFDWHKDYGRDPSNRSLEPRKLTMSVQLTDPSHYEGCELQIRAGNQIDIAPKSRGTIVAFPANVLHRVTPIVSGTRKSLVAWAFGPDFR